MSELWIDRGEGAPRTHALVVGVSKYEFLTDDGSPPPDGRQTFGLAQVRTPATAALRFAQWLDSTYRNTTAPLGTVRLLLSPSDDEAQDIPELAALPATVQRATRGNVQQAVEDWFGDCATDTRNVGILYAAGHGIQMSPDDGGGIVLLEDFATELNVLNHSLDVGTVRKGMAGPTMAQQQFYFVDACRVRPEAAAQFISLGTGVGLPVRFEGRARVSAVYYAATPSTLALGAPGAGTLFAQALLECLNTSLGVANHVQADGSWAVTTATLMQQLPTRVRELAAAHGAEQSATTGGQLEDVPFHVLPGAPDVPVTLQVSPDGAVQCARARLRDPQAGAEIFTGEAFGPITRSVPAGQYLLDVTMQPPTPPFRDVEDVIVPALPPRCGLVVEVGT